MSGGVLADLLPEGIRPWIPGELRRPKAPERYTTCDDCAMLVPGADPDAGDAVFRPDTKCCTYHPWLPNFLVGGLLVDPEPALAAGRSRVLAKIEARVGVTPVGIRALPLSEHLYKIGHGVFGRSETLRCPYFAQDTGGCTVWRYREAACATWFCKYAEGEDGHRLWRAVRAFLEELEGALVIHALLELGFEGDRVNAWLPGRSQLGSREVDRRAPAAREYDEMWGPWVGREGELYGRCLEVVRQVDGEQARAMTGARGRLRLDAIRRLGDRIDRGEVPERLRLNPDLGYSPDGDGRALLTTYSPYDPARISQGLFAALHEFDGRRSNQEAQSAIEARHGFRLSPSLVLRLHRQRILVAS
ncbi:MAG TPA: hypothetical protein VMV46_03435 [Thermoanaerobaculia bacterium]|nr:hypothetical protein [Thermoanaerobaculia bacterium]